MNLLFQLTVTLFNRDFHIFSSNQNEKVNNQPNLHPVRINGLCVAQRAHKLPEKLVFLFYLYIFKYPLISFLLIFFGNALNEVLMLWAPCFIFIYNAYKC